MSDVEGTYRRFGPTDLEVPCHECGGTVFVSAEARDRAERGIVRIVCPVDVGRPVSVTVHGMYR